MLSAQLESARRKIPEGIQQAYCVVVTVSEDNDVQAFRLQVAGGDSLFATIKADPRSRIQTHRLAPIPCFRAGHMPSGKIRRSRDG